MYCPLISSSELVEEQHSPTHRSVKKTIPVIVTCFGSQCAAWRPDPKVRNYGGCGMAQASQSFDDPAGLP